MLVTIQAGIWGGGALGGERAHRDGRRDGGLHLVAALRRAEAGDDPSRRDACRNFDGIGIGNGMLIYSRRRGVEAGAAPNQMDEKGNPTIIVIIFMSHIIAN